jgi:hypothetical protein
MKKVLFASMILVSASASATDLGLSVGRDKTFSKDMTTLSVGTSVAGLKATGSIQTVRDTYVAFGGSVGKSFDVTKSLSVTPSIGVQQINPDRGVNGYAAVAGVEGAYALSKGTAIVASFNHRYDLKDAAAFKGNQVSAGLKVSF